MGQPLLRDPAFQAPVCRKCKTGVKVLQRAGRDDWYEMSVEIVSDSENSEDETRGMDDFILKDCGDGIEARF